MGRPERGAAVAVDRPSIQRLVAFQMVLDGVFERFSDLQESDFDGAVDESLGAIGRFVGADRAYVIRYDADAQLTWMTHEWCAPGIEPSFEEEQGRSFVEAPRQQARLEAFEVNEIRDVRALGEDWATDRAYLEQQGIGAILEVPLVRHGRLVGVIGLDSTGGAVPWTAEDVTMLRAVAALFAQVSERRVAGDGLAAAAEQLGSTVRALHHAEERFAALVDRLPIAVVRVLRDGTVALRNRAADEDELTLVALERGTCDKLGAAVSATLADGTPRKVDFSDTAGGRTGWREASVRAEFDENGRVLSALVLVDDTTERHEHEAELIRAATHDPLTGLPNRTMFDGLLEAAAGSLGASTTSVAVLFVDLDEFKMVNDSLGHRHGDEVLCAMARRLQGAAPPGATVARFGGDEFAVLLHDHDEVSAIEVADTLLDVVTRPVEVAGEQIRTTASIGIATTAEPGQTAELTRWSDVAMYRAKHLGRNRVAVFEDHLSGTMTEMLGLDQRLRRAVEADEFTVAYQPVVRLDTRRIVGAEALVRWTPAGEDPVPAGRFIPLAERNGTIFPIGRGVLRSALGDLATWVRAGLVGDDFVLAVNLSARQLDDADCATEVLDALAGAGLEPHHLSLEITETAALTDIRAAAVTIRAVRDAGVGVAIDDFGTGYGSLQLLQQLAIDRLKLDRSFVERLPGDATADAVARAVTELAAALGLTLVAEGVEREEQRAALLAIGCRLAQGFLLGRPLFRDEFEALLA